MRDLGIPVDLKGSRKRDSLLVITTAHGYTAEELIRDNIIRELPEAFLRLLSAPPGWSAHSLSRPAPKTRYQFVCLLT